MEVLGLCGLQIPIAFYFQLKLLQWELSSPELNTKEGMVKPESLGGSNRVGVDSSGLAIFSLETHRVLD